MSHMQEAYETLVGKLKAELKEAMDDADIREYRRMDAEEILRDYIYKHHGKKVLMELAREIDKKWDRKDDYTDMIDCNYEE